VNWDSVKKPEDVVLDGITVTIERCDGTIKVVEMTDKSGHQFRITGDYGINTYVPAKPKMVTRFALIGLVMGLPVDETFEHEFQANDRKSALSDACTREDACDLKVEKREVAE
jgi:hypothetical protein